MSFVTKTSVSMATQESVIWTYHNLGLSLIVHIQIISDFYSNLKFSINILQSSFSSYFLRNISISGITELMDRKL